MLTLQVCNDLVIWVADLPTQGFSSVSQCPLLKDEYRFRVWYIQDATKIKLFQYLQVRRDLKIQAVELCGAYG